jgi:hypothetical protein
MQPHLLTLLPLLLLLCPASRHSLPAPCSGVGAAFNVVCLILCFVFPAKNRPPKAESQVGFFRRFSSSIKGKSSQAALERDTEVGSDVSKSDLEHTTNIVADSSRL